MCGIVGVISTFPAAEAIFQSLQRLEYRGYDSAGIATLVDGAIDSRRVSGKLSNLQTALIKSPLKGNIGIGHTRWATHGAPTESNAHPHSTSRATIVHNGIIENFEELRSELIAAGQVFNSDTDSETVVQLIDFYLHQGLSPIEATKKTLQRLKGAYALAIIFAGHEDMMIGARHGAPLVVGFGENGTFLGSDSLALASLAKKIIYLHDGDWTVISQKNVDVFDLNGSPVHREIHAALLEANSIGKDGYRHYMQKELHEHPAVIGQTLLRMINPATRVITLPPMPFALKDIKRVTMTACGSAFYAGWVSRYWMEEYARLSMDIDIASELRYRQPPVDKNDMGLLISQSGETADTLAALHWMRENEQYIVSVLNVEQSSMARESDVVLGTVAGPEICVASTKAFTAQLTVLACLVLAFARARKAIDRRMEEKLIGCLMDLPGIVSEALLAQRQIRLMAQIVAQSRDVLYLGRGSLVPIAFEGALKLKEVSYIHAEAYAAGEMKHGPIALIDSTVPVIVICPSGVLFEKTFSNLQEAYARGARILAVTDAHGAEKLHSVAESVVVVPECNPFVAPILYAVPIQYLAYEVALLKGTEIDQPRNLAKSVTVE